MIMIIMIMVIIMIMIIVIIIMIMIVIMITKSTKMILIKSQDRLLLGAATCLIYHQPINAHSCQMQPDYFNEIFQAMNMI